MTFAAVFLVVARIFYAHAWALYWTHLVQAKQYHSLTTWSEYWSVPDSLFFLKQMSVLLLLFRPFGSLIASRAPRDSMNRSEGKSIALGLLAGLVTFLAGTSFVGGPLSSTLGLLLVNHFFSVSTVILVLLVAVFIPAASELFFEAYFFVGFFTAYRCCRR